MPKRGAARDKNALVLQEHGGVRVARAERGGQLVLVKSLVTGDPEVRARFSREGDIAERLSGHPNIVPLVKRNDTELVFAYIQGGNLRDRFEQGVLDPLEAIDVLRGLMSALGYAHARGITHLDLKPENILLEGARVRVADFGQAHDRSMPRITTHGQRLGTPHYMPPEQYQGVRNDPRSDIYSAGVVLFEALSGSPPYHDPFRWLVGLPCDRLPLPYPRALHALLDASLARDSRARPQSALAFLIALEQASERLA